MREKFKRLFRTILKRDYSDDTTATIIYLIANTTTPELTLDKIIEIVELETDDEKTYQKLTELIEN